MGVRARWDGADPNFLARSGEFPAPELIPYLVDRLVPGAAPAAGGAGESRAALLTLLLAAGNAFLAVMADRSGGRTGAGCPRGGVCAAFGGQVAAGW